MLRFQLTILLAACLSGTAFAPPVQMQIHRSLSGQLQTLRLPAPEEKLPPRWVNPSIHDPGVRSRDGAPEGLILVDDDGNPTDQLDLHKGVAVYIHGWTPTGGPIPTFPYARFWRQRGWNTFVYRWHTRSNAPFFEAESRASSGEIAGDMTGQFQLLRRILDQGKPGSYPGEIRFIGYSLGAYVALLSAQEAFYKEDPYAALDWRNHRLRRVDLIDPAFIESFLRADQVWLGGYQHTQVLTTPEVDRKAVGVPSHLRSWGIPVLAFTATVDRIVAPHLEQTMPTQSLSEKWSPTGRTPDNEDQHLRILQYYFRSIADPPARVINGRRAFSAQTPTASLKHASLIKLVQVAGMDRPDETGQVFVEEQVPGTRGGVQVDQEPIQGSDAVITFPVVQLGY